MTIPLSLVGQIVLNGQKASALYWVGAVAVVLSFVFVSEEEKEEEEDGNEAAVATDEESLVQHGARGSG
jgi:solute carrier family 35 protein F5